MVNNIIKFNLLSGGSLTIDLEKCADCNSRMCIEACGRIGKPGILIQDEDGMPSLSITPEAAAAGGCVECLGCEFECEIHGRKAIAIELDMPAFDKLLNKEG